MDCGSARATARIGMLVPLLWAVQIMQARPDWQDESSPVEAVVISLRGGPTGAAARLVLEDSIRKALDVFPGTTYRNLLIDFGLDRVRRLATVANADVSVEDGSAGGVVLRVIVDIDPGRVASDPPVRFPVLARGDDWLAKLKVTAAGVGYTNHNAWYGQPGAFLAANPLVRRPAGAGWSGFGEGALEGGVQGIFPVARDIYAYGSLSWLGSSSTGQDLFVTGSRFHDGVEDAYAGLVGGRTFEDGSRLVVNVSGGRQPFQISDGMLIRLASANGFGRAALQLNPRWTADRLWLAQVRYNTTKVELFQLDPDELPAIDTRTVIAGANLETGLGTAWQSGLTYLTVPQSTYGYYTPTASGTRRGLHVADARLAYIPSPAGGGPFARVEAAVQWNDRNSFSMLAMGGFGEAGYRWADVAWSPTLSYRLSAFSGDRPSTARFERWDPLLSGGSGEEWVQGLNHYKLVQDSNIVAHRLQARLRPAPQWEFVPQVWLFQATSRNNIGGIVSSFAGHSLGWEANLTAKYFASRNVLVQGSVAMTTPLQGMRDAVPGPTGRWFSAMTFIRASF